LSVHPYGVLDIVLFQPLRTEKENEPVRDLHLINIRLLRLDDSAFLALMRSVADYDAISHRKTGHVSVSSGVELIRLL
jgi:hypothetical protein